MIKQHKSDVQSQEVFLHCSLPLPRTSGLVINSSQNRPWFITFYLFIKEINVCPDIDEKLQK